MSRPNVVNLLGRIVFSILATASLQAQTATSELSGAMLEGGVPLSGVVVELRSGKLQIGQTTRPDGGFRFCCLAPGNYSLTFKGEGIPEGELPVLLLPGQTHHLEGILLRSADQPWLLREIERHETSAYDSSRTYSSGELQRLPTTLHLWTVMANIEVSMTPERFDVAGLHAADAMLFGARGDSWSQNRILLNGFEVPHGDGSDTAFVPDLASTESLTYAPGPSKSARPGAEIFLQSRLPSEVFQGEVQAFFQGAALQGSNVTSRLKDFGITEPDERYRHALRGNIQIGGRLTQEWQFSASAGRLQNSRRIRNHLLPVRSERTTIVAQAVGDLSSSDRLVLQWTGQTGRQPESGSSPQITREASHDARQSFNQAQATWTRMLSPRTSISAGASFSAGRLDAGLQPDAGASRENMFPGFVDVPLVPSAESGRPIVEQLNNVFTGSAPIASSTRLRQVQLLLNMNTTSRTGALTHRISAGIDSLLSRNTLRSSAFEDINLRFFRGNPDSVIRLNQADNSNSTSSVRWFGRDSIGLGNLVIDVSGHAGWTRGDNRLRSGGEENRLNFVDAGIHVGAAYVAVWRYPTSFRAAVARSHYESILLVLRAIHPDGLSWSAHSWNDLNQDGAFQAQELGQLLKTAGPRFTRADSAIKSPFANYVHLGIAQRLPGSLSISLDAFRRVAHNLHGFLNTGVPETAYAPVQAFDPGDDGASATGDEQFVLAYNQLPETLGQDAYLLTNPAGEHAFAEGYEARLTRAGVRFRMELAVTRYRAVARTPAGNGPRRNDWSAFSVVNDPNQAINAYGSTYFDRGLGARFWGILQLRRDTHLGWIVNYLDGAPYGRILPVTGLNQGLTAILATVRGPGNGSRKGGKRTAFNLTADLRVSHGFRSGAGRFTTSLDIFNLLNRAAALHEADVTSPAHLWRIPLSFQTPRSIQVGLRYNW